MDCAFIQIMSKKTQPITKPEHHYIFNGFEFVQNTLIVAHAIALFSLFHTSIKFPLGHSKLEVCAKVSCILLSLALPSLPPSPPLPSFPPRIQFLNVLQFQFDHALLSFKLSCLLIIRKLQSRIRDSLSRRSAYCSYSLPVQLLSRSHEYKPFYQGSFNSRFPGIFLREIFRAMVEAAKPRRMIKRGKRKKD